MARRRCIFDPVLGLSGGAGADVDAEEGLGPDQLGKVEILASPEGVAFLIIAPPAIERDRPLRARTDAVAPVIGVRVTAARPAEDWNVQRPERLDDVAPVAADVWNG